MLRRGSTSGGSVSPLAERDGRDLKGADRPRLFSWQVTGVSKILPLSLLYQSDLRLCLPSSAIVGAYL